VNQTGDVSEEIASAVNTQLVDVNRGLDDAKKHIEDSENKLAGLSSAFLNVSIEFNQTFYRVGEKIGELQREIDVLKKQVKERQGVDLGDFGKALESAGDGFLDVLKKVIKLPFEAGSIFDYIVKAVSYGIMILAAIFIGYIVIKIIMFLIPSAKEFNNVRKLKALDTRVKERRSPRVLDSNDAAMNNGLELTKLNRRRTHDELELTSLEKESIYFTENHTVNSTPNRTFSVVEVENIPPLRLLKLCNMLKQKNIDSKELYMIRKSAPSQKPDVMKHYSLEPDTCKYIVHTYRHGGYAIHF
jgi:hypothetical protein